jgi:hypothetical protein
LPTPTSTPVVNNRADQQEVTPVSDSAESPTETPTTNPDFTPTSTRVLQATPTETAATDVTPTPTVPPVAQIPSSGGVLPAAGNDFLIWAGVALLVLLTFGVVRHLRSLSSGAGD